MTAANCGGTSARPCAFPPSSCASATSARVSATPCASPRCYACLIRRLSRLDREGALPAEPPTEIINENRWLAQRYGILAFLGDTSEGGRKDIEDSAAELVEELADDARALGCEQELRHTLTIIREGTGADRQIDLFRLRRVEGDADHQALRAVVDLVIEETREGTAEGG